MADDTTIQQSRDRHEHPSIRTMWMLLCLLTAFLIATASCRAAEPAASPEEIRFEMAMKVVSARFTSLSQEPDLFWDVQWNAETTTKMRTAQEAAQRLAEKQPMKANALRTVVEAMRIGAVSLEEHDLMGLVSVTRLLQQISDDLR